MKEAFVYRWYDLSNDKMYIGSHKGTVDDGYIGSGKLFNRAYNKRPDDFVRDILFEGTHYQCLIYEETILKYLDAANNQSYYNMVNDSLGGTTGLKHSNETKRKISEIQKGKKRGPRPKYIGDKISKVLTGRKLSNEHRMKISQVQQGVKKPKRTKEHCENISLSKMKKVYSKELYMYFDSQTECAEYFNMSIAQISRILNGKTKSNKYGLIKM